MPKCKNDSKKYYRGTEPSPKGRGYCAHAYKVGEIQKGKNGKTWRVEITKNKIKRWVQRKYKLINIQIPSEYTDKFIDMLHKANTDFKNHFDGTGIDLTTGIYDIWYYPIPYEKAIQMKKYLTKKRFPHIHKIIYKDF